MTTTMLAWPHALAQCTAGFSVAAGDWCRPCLLGSINLLFLIFVPVIYNLLKRTISMVITYS
jgi:hypothetical protein